GASAVPHYRSAVHSQMFHSCCPGQPDYSVALLVESRHDGMKLSNRLTRSCCLARVQWLLSLVLSQCDQVSQSIQLPFWIPPKFFWVQLRRRQQVGSVLPVPRHWRRLRCARNAAAGLCSTR